MAKSTGPILAVGAVTILDNQVLDGKPWAEALPVVLMTGVAALLLAGLEQLSPALATGLAWLALITRVFVIGGASGNVATKFLNWQKGS